MRAGDYVLLEGTGPNVAVDLGENLPDNFSRADVEVTDLGVSHLAFGEPNILTGGRQLRVGVLAKGPFDEGGMGFTDGSW